MMNKQELIKNIKFLAREASQQWPHEEMVELRDVLREISQLDEPEVLLAGEEPLYYALIKGHELVDSYDIYWNVDRSDYGVFVSRLHPPHDNFITEMSKEAWNELGIDETNAVFVKVEE